MAGRSSRSCGWICRGLEHDAAERHAAWTTIRRAASPDPESPGCAPPCDTRTDNSGLVRSPVGWTCIFSDHWPKSAADEPIPGGMNQIGELLLPGPKFGLERVGLNPTPPILTS